MPFYTILRVTSFLLLLLFLALLLVDVFFCFFMRLLFPNVINYWNVTDYLISDAEKYRLQQNFDGDLGWVNIMTGALGERTMRTSYGTPLLLSFGDSFVFGDEVQDHETWQAQLADMLHQDIYNFGVNGYGLDQSYLYFQKVTASFKAPYFVLGLTKGGINRVVNSYRKFLFPWTGIPLTKPRYTHGPNGFQLISNPIKDKKNLSLLRDKDFVTDLCLNDFWGQLRRFRSSKLRFSCPLVLSASFWTHFIRTFRSNELSTPFKIDLWKEPGATNIVQDILKCFSNDAQKLGGKPLVILFPERNDVDAYRLSGEEGVPELSKICVDLGIEFFDGVQLLAKTAASSRDLNTYYARGGHLSDIGNGVIAKGLKKILKEETLLE